MGLGGWWKVPKRGTAPRKGEAERSTKSALPVQVGGSGVCPEGGRVSL